MMNEHVHSIMTKNPITVKPTDRLTTISKLFQEHRIHHLPVVDDTNVLVGIVTTYDLWKLNEDFSKYAQIHVHEVMSTKLAKINPNDKVGTAAELFLDNRFHALPVVEDGKLVGIVTSFDVLRYNFIREYDRPILYKDVYERGLRAVS